MYIPAHFAADGAAVRELLARHGAADLITLTEHGRVVPTWNYVTAHVYGQLVVHDDPAWVEDVVRRLTAKHEAARVAVPGQAPAWSVDDAPRAFVEGQL